MDEAEAKRVSGSEPGTGAGGAKEGGPGERAIAPRSAYIAVFLLGLVALALVGSLAWALLGW